MLRSSLLCLSVLLILLTGCGREKRRGPTGGTVDTAMNIAIAPPIKPAINVYIENSGSMDGYVKGATEFENAVYNYLSDIMISGVSDSLNLFYINSKIIKYGSDIQDFIEKLEPATFRARGGDRGTSDIANVIDAVLTETQENDVAILVTDGIFSPGKGKDATEYLGNQQIGIKRRMADHLKKYPNTAVIVYQLSSGFNGIYYNKVDDHIPLNGQRPFYIWVIGDAEHLTYLRNKVSDSRFKGSGIQNVFTSVSGNQSVKYALHPSIGKYKKSKIKNTIEKLEKDSKTKKVRFAVNVDFSDLLLDDGYLTNSDNYANNSQYTLEVEPYAKGGYTHTLYFTASDDKIHKGAVSVKLKAKLPDWIENVNDDEGVTAVTGKTYGIKYQLGGIFDAFTFSDNYYTEIKININ
jgi:hypothetical protein